MTTRHVTEGKKMETVDDSDSSGDCVLMPTCDVTETERKETSDDSDSGYCVFVPSKGDVGSTSRRHDVSNAEGKQTKTSHDGDSELCATSVRQNRKPKQRQRCTPTPEDRRESFGVFAKVAMDMTPGSSSSQVFQAAQSIAHGQGFQLTTKSGRNNKNLTLCCPAKNCGWMLPMRLVGDTWVGSSPLDKRSRACFVHSNPLRDEGGCVPVKIGVAEAKRLLFVHDPYGNYEGLKFVESAAHFKLKTGLMVSNDVAWKAMKKGTHNEREHKWQEQFTKLDGWHDHINTLFPGSNCAAEYHNYTDQSDGQVLTDEHGVALDYFHRSFFTMNPLCVAAASCGCDLIEIDGGAMGAGELKGYKILLMVMGTGNLTNLILGSAVVPSESHDNVRWFLHKMKNAGWNFVLNDRKEYERPLTALTDEGGTLRTGVAEDLSKAAHRLCLKHVERHIEGLKGRKLYVAVGMKYLHAASKCSQEEEASLIMQALAKVDPVVANYAERTRPQWSLYTAVSGNLATRGVVASNKAENAMFLTKSVRNSEGVVNVEMRVAELMTDSYMRCARTARECMNDQTRHHAYLTPNVQSKWRQSVEDSKHMTVHKIHIPGERYVIDSPAVYPSTINDFVKRCPSPLSAEDQTLVDALRSLSRRKILLHLNRKECGCGQYQTNGWPCACAALAILSHAKTSQGKSDPCFDPSTEEFATTHFSAELLSRDLFNSFPATGMPYSEPSMESLPERSNVRPPQPIGEHDGTLYRVRRPQLHRFGGHAHGEKDKTTSRQHRVHHTKGRALATDPNQCSRCRCVGVFWCVPGVCVRFGVL